METKVLKLRILPTAEQEQSLVNTMQEYTRVCNIVSNWIFNNGFEISHHRVNAAIYHDIRSQSTLTARLVQDTFRTVCARYQTVQTQLSKVDTGYKDSNGKKIRKTLEWLWKPIEFKKLQCDLTHGIDYSFVDGGEIISISTINGRQRMSFLTCDYWQQYFEGWKLGTAKLIHRNHKWYLHIPASRELTEYDKTQTQTVVGIDRGTRFLATVYDGRNTFFWSGKEIMHKRDKFAKTRQNLQAHNTRYSRRRLRKIGQRENRWMSHLNHVATKALVETYGSNTVFAIEDLEGVSFEEKNLKHRSANGKRQLRSWAFYQFEMFLKYKAEAAGSYVLTINPRYTSQRCPNCCIVDKDQRDHVHHEYKCSCGFRSNDDRVGAMNIQELGNRWVSGEDKPKYTKTKNLAIAM